MPKNRRTFSWLVTRVLFSIGMMAVFFGLAGFPSDSIGPSGWLVVLVGVALVAISTRGPWDSEASGRNRSVLGFHARPNDEQPTSKS